MEENGLRNERIYGVDWIKQSDHETRLISCYCNNCHSSYFPKRQICPNCFKENLIEQQLSNDGEVYSYSVLHVASKGFETPLTIAYVDFPEGVRVCGQVEGDVEIGSKVKVTFGKIRTDADGVTVLSYKFKTLT